MTGPFGAVGRPGRHRAGRSPRRGPGDQECGPRVRASRVRTESVRVYHRCLEASVTKSPRSLRLGWPLAASAASTRRRSAREASTGDSRVRVRPSERQSHVTYGVVLGVLVVDVGAVVLAQVEGRVGEEAVHRLAAPENVHLRPG